MRLSNFDRINNKGKYYVKNILHADEGNKTFDERCYRFLANKKLEYVDRLCITFRPEDINDKKLETIVNYAVSIALEDGVKRRDIIVAVDCQNKNFNFTDEEWKKLEDLERKLKFKGIKFGIEDERATWPIGLAKKTDRSLKFIAEDIKSKNLSPLETLFAVWTEVTSYEYKDTEKHNEAIPRSVMGIMNTNYIVCVGYSNYFRTICEYINNPNIAVFKNNVQSQDDENEIAVGHQNLVVHVKDNKYGVKGFYYLDPTYDATFEGEDGTVSFFMLPLSDISNLQTKIYNIFTEVPAPKGKEEEYKNNVISPLYHMNENEDGNGMSINAVDCLLDTRIKRFILRDKEFYNLICADIKAIRNSGKHFPKYSSKIQECCRYLDENPGIAEDYLKDNSKPIGLSTFISAYNVALRTRFSELSKDDVSLYVYDEITNAILNANYYKKGAVNCFNECAEPKKDDEIIKM